MTIYLFTIVVLFLFSLCEQLPLSPASRKGMALVMYLFLVFQVGLRWETGTDWDPYLAHFKSIDSFSSTSVSIANQEYGYNVAVWLIKLVSPDYSVFLVTHAAVYYFLIFNSVKRYTGMLYLPLLMFYSTTMGVTGSNRQLIAVAIGLYSLRYLRDGRKFHFAFLIAIACLFHYSALILLVFYLFNLRIGTVTLLLLLACSIAIGASPLPALIFSTIGNLLGGMEAYKAAVYLGQSPDSLLASGLSILGLVKRLVLLSLFFYNRKALSAKLPYYNMMLNGYIMGVVLYFLFANSLLILVSRGSLYFDVLEPLLLASQVYLWARRADKFAWATALCPLSIVFFFQSISPYADLFLPYTGVFINPDYSRMMY